MSVLREPEVLVSRPAATAPTSQSPTSQWTTSPWTQPPATQYSAAIIPRGVSSPLLDPGVPAETAARVLTGILAAVGLSPALLNGPFTPIESPMFWAIAAAWCRRQEQQNWADATPSLAYAPDTTGQPNETATARAMSLQTSAAAVAPTIGVPDRATGTVIGQINAPGTYSVTAIPTRGTATIDSTGRFTYTPTNAARMAAAQDPSADFDSFTITVTNGQASTPVTVRVPISAARLQVDQSTTVGSTPTGVAVSGNKVYIANRASKTVSVLDSTNTVIATVPVGTAPTGVAANPNGKWVYVANNGSNNVSVIDTATNKVVSTITVGTSPTAVAVNPSGTRTYVTNTGNILTGGTVSVIDTTTINGIATNKVIATIKVGTSPTAVALNPTGTRAYVTNAGNILTGGTVSVIDTATNKVVSTIGVGSTPNAVALNPSGTRAYVTNYGSNSVSVIDTTTNTRVATIGVGSRPTAVLVTPDGSAVYVVSDTDTLTVIDTKTNTVVSNVAIDTPAEAGAHSIALSANRSRILVTDAIDGRVRALSLAHVNSAPAGTVTVSAPRASDGAVIVTLETTDPDGDPVTAWYSSATSGAVLGSPDGVYTYIPTRAARDQALQTPGPDSDGFSIRLDDGQASSPVWVTRPDSPVQHGPTGRARQSIARRCPGRHDRRGHRTPRSRNRSGHTGAELHRGPCTGARRRNRRSAQRRLHLHSNRSRPHRRRHRHLRRRGQ